MFIQQISMCETTLIYLSIDEIIEVFHQNFSHQFLVSRHKDPVASLVQASTKGTYQSVYSLIALELSR